MICNNCNNDCINDNLHLYENPYDSISMKFNMGCKKCNLSLFIDKNKIISSAIFFDYNNMQVEFLTQNLPYHKWSRLILKENFEHKSLKMFKDFIPPNVSNVIETKEYIQRIKNIILLS